MITRRTLLTRSLAAGAALTMPPRLWAATETQVGTLTVTTLSDGHLSLPESFLYGDLDTAEVASIVEASGTAAGGLEPPCNVTLLRRGDDLVLFDAGSGSNFMPSAGELLDALDAAGIAPGDITHVVFTHGHPDHLWGVLDDFDEPVFVNAQHLMGGEELSYWSDPETVNTIGAERQSFAVGASRRLEMLAGLETFSDGEAIVPGVTAMATPGHTPGHMSFEIADGDERLIVVGDAIGNAHVALKRPAWHAPADQDPGLGAATRVALLDRLAEAGTGMVGFHLPDGGMGRIVRDGGAYGWQAL